MVGSIVPRHPMDEGICSMTDPTLQQTDRSTPIEGVIAMLDAPAAIVADCGMIIGSNQPWRQVANCSVNQGGHATLESSLRGFDGLKLLLAELKDSSLFHQGELQLCAAESLQAEDPSDAEYTVRWQWVDGAAEQRSLAVVMLLPSRTARLRMDGSDMQRARIDRLLVRQTLIEEAERLRLGRELHDTVVQDLVLTKAKITDLIAAGKDPAEAILSIDRIIDQIRTLSFELSPPILNDLGLLPALHWLAEHLKSRYGVDLSVIDNGGDPALSVSSRTVVFRAVRELAINAAKHAAGSEILITCLTYPTTVRVRVRDFSKGFDVSGTKRFVDGSPGYGLLSVEQQVKGIGGKFELFSEIGEGTRATITLPLEPSKRGSDDE